jgi:hypothetical protein
MKSIIAKFNSTCSETGKALKKGSTIYFDTSTRKAYHPESQKVKDHKEGRSDAGLSTAQEDAYFDNFCQANNI